MQKVPKREIRKQPPDQRRSGQTMHAHQSQNDAAPLRPRNQNSLSILQGV